MGYKLHFLYMASPVRSPLVSADIRTLTKTISALQVVATENGVSRTGLFTQICPGAQITICGAGFNDRTVKVLWGKSCYFVFRDDLEAPVAI